MSAKGVASCVVLWVSMIACGGANAPSATPSTKPPPVKASPSWFPMRRFALLATTAVLRSDDAPTAQTAQYFRSVAEAKDDDADPTPVMVAIAEHGDFVELENAHVSDQCHRSLVALEDLRLRFVVAKRDVRAVTVRAVHASYDDGSSVELTGGVPLVRRDDGWYAEVDGFSFPMPLAEGDAGFTYDASPIFDPYADGADVTWREPVVGSVHFAGRQTKTFPFAHDVGTLMTPRARRVGDHLVATATMRCARYHLALAPEAIADDNGEIYGVGGLGLSGSAAQRVRAGATVYWRSGAVAGETLRGTTIGAAADPSGNRLCFRAPVRYGDDAPTFDLCFDRADVMP